ncbi:hypothetical protein BGW38_006945 [Lunasporangiospora selenospora]|uniref:DDE-1 domain-containing protein n=1 Tax=Lunasporangiospora selenospora TaxID=979761 RepID=A0A9P6G2I5_9FUNG|nr:hypothetical protein BGW38_006945 [Lunasporangiospora selenospora]
MQDAAKSIFTILADEKDPDDVSKDTTPCFSVSWFDDFKKHHNITYVKLRGEAGSVDLEKIEPELEAIRARCARYSPDNIYNCDKTGLYLKQLDPKSHTTVGDTTAGVKADKNCRHNNTDYSNPDTKTLWKHLDVVRLPVNSTSVTQPLDVEVISVFKRVFLGMLCRKTSVVRTLTDDKVISDGQAWDLIPSPEIMHATIRSMPITDNERIIHESSTKRLRLADQERLYFEHLVAETSAEKGWEIKGAAESDILATFMEEETLSDMPLHDPNSTENDDQQGVAMRVLLQVTFSSLSQMGFPNTREDNLFILPRVCETLFM